MAKDPGFGYKVTGTVIDAKGTCNAGHKVGDKFDLCIHNCDGLCGVFFNGIFANLSTFQFGGKFPWWEGESIFANCPDPQNTVSIRLERSER